MMLNGDSTIKETYDYLVEKNTTGIPIVDSDNKYLGIVTLKDLAREIISGNYNKLDTSYDNIELQIIFF